MECPKNVRIYWFKTEDRKSGSGIAQRGRSFEQIENQEGLKDYYAQVHDEYPDWYKNYNISPKLRIDGDSIDFVNNPEHLDEVLGQIDNELKKLDLL